MKKYLFNEITLLAAAALLSIMATSSCKKAETPEPSYSNCVILDGEVRPILEVTVDEIELNNGNIDLYVYYTHLDYVKIQLNYVLHNDKVLDLTKKEEEHDGWYWVVNLYDQTKGFFTFGDPGSGFVIFTTGTLKVTRLNDIVYTHAFDIEFKNGRITDDKYGDGQEHTIEIYYNGPVTKD